MGRRPDVPTASAPIAAIAIAGLAESMLNALVRVPFRRPWVGPASIPHNVGASVTRQVMRSFMGYASSLPIEEFRSMELVIDAVSGTVLPPAVRARGVSVDEEVVGGVPGMHYTPRGAPEDATILYFHGGGYIGTSPSMYAAFTGALARGTGLRIFVADYRLAPEFPYPAGLEDALAVYRATLEAGVPASRVFVAGDSGGGGLVHSLLAALPNADLPRPAGAILFSPEVDLRLNAPSISENAPKDILPWNIPTMAYLHGVAAADARVSALSSDLGGYPPVFVCFGDEEMFRDPIRRFVDLLTLDGVESTVVEADDMFHVFPILMPWAEASREVFAVVGGFVNERLEPAAG